MREFRDARLDCSCAAAVGWERSDAGEEGGTVQAQLRYLGGWDSGHFYPSMSLEVKATLV